MVCIEDLQVRNMSRSAASSVDKPGKNLRAKSGLNKSILDQGWFECRRQLDYKLAWNGGHLACRTAAQHQPHLSGMQTCIRRQPQDTSAVHVCGVRL